MKIEIKRINGSVLYTAEIADDRPECRRLRDAVQTAVRDGAYLDGANLDGAYLDGAYLGGASLGGANLRGANLGGDTKLTGPRPIVMMGPIGSRNDTLTVFRTDAGLRVQTGCFFGTDAEFLAGVAETHGDSRHGSDYRAALALTVQMLAEDAR